MEIHSLKGGCQRQTYFVCCALKDFKLLSELIEADDTGGAIDLFYLKHNIKAEQIFGPFYKKKTKVIESNRSLKFSDGKAIRCIYDNWEVDAFKLIEPHDAAYLIFIKRIDDKKVTAPKGTVVVGLSELGI